MRATLSILLLLGLTSTATAQSEESLRRYFEGKSVVVKLEMPGTEDGVDVYPGTSMPVDFPRHAGRLKKFGTAVRRGQEILVTKVKIKKDLIEFQLGGGGYGTFSDDTDTHVSTNDAPKSEREKNLEKDLPALTDPAAKRKAREELDALRRERERANNSNRAQVAEAQQIKDANIRQRRAASGSRFNLRYKPVVPSDAMTPDGVMRALAEYVDFSPVLAGGKPGLHGEGDRGDRPRGVEGLRKGLTVDEVDEILGRPESIASRMEGSLKVSLSTYLTKDRRVEAEFVEGVLIRFTASSR